MDAGDFLVIFGESICVHLAIMHNFPIKEPRSTQEDMASIHGHNIYVILVSLPNG